MYWKNPPYAVSVWWIFLCYRYKYDVVIKRYFDPSDTELLRALHSRNSKNIRNSLIFLQKMASYSCFWQVQGHKSSCKQACIGFMTFCPWYLVIIVMKVSCMYRWHSHNCRHYSWSGLLPCLLNTGLAAKCLCFLACKYTIHLTTWQHFHKSI